MIEFLREEDIDEAVSVGEFLHKESVWNHIAFNRDSSINYVRFMLNNPKYGFIIVLKSEGKIVGGIVATISKFPFSLETFSDIYMLFILKEHRGSISVIKLINRYIEVAKEYGVSEIHAGCNTPEAHEKVGKLYGYVGFTQSGSQWSITC